MIIVIFRIILFSPFWVALALLFLLGTTTGLKFSFDIASALSAGRIKFSMVEGHNISSFSVKDFSYQDLNVSFFANELNVDWAPWQMLKNTFLIQKISVSGLDFKLHSILTSGGKSTQATFPINLVVKQGDIDHLSIHEKNYNAQMATLHFSGHFFQSAISQQWDGQLSAQGFKMPDYDPSSNMDFLAKSTGILQKDNMKLSVKLLDIKGNLAKQSLKGALDFNLDQGLIKINPSFISLGNARLDMNGRSGKTWDLNWTLNIPRLNMLLDSVQGFLNSKGSIRGPLNKPQLQSELNISIRNKLDFKGNLLANLTYRANDFNLNAKINNGNLRVDPLGIVFKQIMLNLDATKKNANYTITTSSGTGSVTVKGRSDFSQPGFPTQVSIEGNNVEVSHTDIARVIASPHLVLNYLNNHLTLKGSVLIPEANVTPKDFSLAVEMPKETIFLDQKPKEKSTLAIDSDINLKLGDKVHFAYKGLDAFLTGNLDIKDSAVGVTTGSGELLVKSGKFSAYGQQLVIREGRLTFAGGPVTNPGLNVEAVRYLNNYGGLSQANVSSTEKSLVGVTISGSAQAPVVTLFSSPAGLTQTQILSYLILGHGVDQTTTAAEGQTLAQAAMALNLAGGTVSEIQNKLKSTFGLSDFEIASQQEYTTKNVSSPSLVQNTSLILGKYLTAKLYVNLSIGLIEPINTLNASYQITQHWKIQSNANAMGSGLDVIYSIERDTLF